MTALTGGCAPLEAGGSGCKRRGPPPRAALAVACLAIGVAFWTTNASSQARQAQPEDVLPLSELEDPIGVDQDSTHLQQVASERTRAEADARRDDASDRARFGPEPPPLLVRSGEVLTAAPATREVEHRVAVELRPGHAQVELRVALETLAKRPSELRYRLPVPPGSRLLELEVCHALGCRKAAPDRHPEAKAYEAALLARPAPGARTLPVARALRIRDERGEALVVSAAPIVEGRSLRFRLVYVAPAPLHGGVVRFVLPARGMDPQLVPAEVTLSATELRAARVGTSGAANNARVDPWLALPLQASVPPGAPLQATAHHARHEAQLCAEGLVWSGAQPAKPVDLIVALDVSPSTEGPARGRLVAAIHALLAAAPPGSRVRALAFASRASPLVEAPRDPAEVTLAPFAAAIGELQLGSATRFEAAWQVAKRWLKAAATPSLRPLLAIVGDGGLTRGQARAFEEARSAGVQVVAINVSDVVTSAALGYGVLRSGGLVLEVGAEAEAAARGQGSAPLEERIAAVYAPTLATRVAVRSGSRRIELGALRAGEALRYQACGKQPITLDYAGRSLDSRPAHEALRVPGPGAAKWENWVAVDAGDLQRARAGDWPAVGARAHCDRRGPAQRASGLSSDTAPIGLAEERVCNAPKAVGAPTSSVGAAIGAGMPSEPLLAMLRQRILPVARGCFRRDRAGQLRYEKRATFVFSLAEREVTNAYIDGTIPTELRSCLLAAVDQLEVPRFAGIVNVRYPLITQSEPKPEQIELQGGTSDLLDRLFRDQEIRELDQAGGSLHTPPASNVERVRR